MEINLARLALYAVAGLLLLVLVLSVRSCSRNRAKMQPEDPDAVEVLDSLPAGKAIPYYCRKISYSKTFCDLNDVHLEAAHARGLKKVPESREDIESGGSELTPIISNKWLTVGNLTHSAPYLTSAAAGELSAIAHAFRDSLSAHGLPQYRIIVTSVLRTGSDVRRLRRSGNVNASDDSAHCYGTTFDISYVRYDKVQPGGDWMEPYDLTKVLAEVLMNERDAKRIYVKYEVKQHCFHITSRM